MPPWGRPATVPAADWADPPGRRAGRRDAPRFGGRLTPRPLGVCEASLLRGIATAMRDAEARSPFETRYRFIRDALGLGVGTDPDLIEGLDHVLRGLSLLRSDRDGPGGFGNGGARGVLRGGGRGSGAVRRGRTNSPAALAVPARAEHTAAAGPTSPLEASLARYEEARRRSTVAPTRGRTDPARSAGMRPTADPRGRFPHHR